MRIEENAVTIYDTDQLRGQSDKIIGALRDEPFVGAIETAWRQKARVIDDVLVEREEQLILRRDRRRTISFLANPCRL